MTKATLFTQEGLLVGFRLAGHAGYAASGADIVCSALSAVTHMTAVGLTQGLEPLVKVEDDKGRMVVLVRRQQAQAAQVLLRALELELGAIAQQYPHHLRIIYAERREFKCFS